MSKFAIRLLTLAMYATSLVLVVPAVTSAKAETSSSGHTKKHRKTIQKRRGFSDPSWSVGQAQSFAAPYSQAGPVCSGLSRGIDCRVWPPPSDDDPDRKRAGGGG